MTQRRLPATTLRLGLAASTLCLLAAGCSSSSGGGSNPSPPRTTGSSAPAASPAAATPPSTTSAATASTTGGLSGTWSGDYQGAYSGTFKLTWQQSGTALTGTIQISGFGNAPDRITGSANGSAITFGTVGTNAVSYRGSVLSPSAMSGTWHLQAASGTGGSWTATKAP